MRHFAFSRAFFIFTTRESKMTIILEYFSLIIGHS